MATQPSLPNQTVQRKFASVNEYTQNIELTLSMEQTVLTAAQLNALKTTPIALTQPGVQAGEIVLVDYVSLTYTFKTTAYTLNAGTLKFYYGPPANNWPITADLSGILTQAASKASIAWPTVNVGPDSLANMCQQSIYLGNTGTANYTLGDATLTVNVFYSKSTN